MKKYLIVLISVIVIADGSCKKDKPVKPSKWKVTTIAGSERGFLNGPALSAKFSAPVDVAVTPDGETIYVTDPENSRIRKIAGGQVSTFAGTGVSGIVNGPGISAQFKYPYIMALDVNGNLYVSDFLVDNIRKISTTAEVTNFSYAAAWSEIGAQSGIVIDAAGNVYIADSYNQSIRKINAAGMGITLAGSNAGGFKDGNAAEAKFNQPSGIALDKQGNLYVADPYNFRIRKITPAGQVSTFAGNGVFGHADGSAGTAKFTFPVDIVIDSHDNLYVSDGHRIRQITPQGDVSTIAGSTAGYVDGNGSTAKFNGEIGLAIDAHDNIYVADFGNSVIRKISME
jgi:DNA-binding beta-propeller fold protein YncE